MIMVIGRIEAKPKHHPEILDLCLDHVQRSRQENGCIDHRVSIDAENENRFVFVEYWKDAEALKTHFELEASKRFVQNLIPIIESKPDMQIFKTEEVSI